MRFAAILFLLVCSVSARAEGASDSKGSGIGFRWAFAAITGADDNRHFLSVQRDTVLYSGDQFKIMIQLQDSCYVYVLHRGPNDAVQLMYPPELPLKLGEQLHLRNFIPAEGWYKFDDQTGKERFYLLASAAPLTELEKMISQHSKADSTAQPSLAGGIVKEIRRLRKERTELSSVAERSVTIAGNLRGDSDRIVESAVEISAPAFYAKTITIDHR